MSEEELREGIVEWRSKFAETLTHWNLYGVPTNVLVSLDDELIKAIHSYTQEKCREARLDEWKQFGEFLSESDKRVVGRNFLDLYRLHGERLLERESTETHSTEYGKWDGAQADNREQVKYEETQLNRSKGSKPMTKSIKEVLEQTIQISDIGHTPDAIPEDGSKDWFTANGRVFRFRIDLALKEIEAIVKGANPANVEGIMAQSPYFAACKDFEANLLTALYGKDEK